MGAIDLYDFGITLVLFFIVWVIVTAIQVFRVSVTKGIPRTLEEMQEQFFKKW